MGYTYFMARAAYPNFRGQSWYTSFGSSEQAVRDDNKNAIEIKVEQKTLDEKAPVLRIADVGHNSQWYSRCDLVLVGTPYNAKGSTMGYSYYTTPSALEKAKAWWEDERKRLKAISDAYYSQPWV